MSSASRHIPRQSRAEQRVADLLEAAGEVIAERGYEAATLTDIAARADASIGSIYRYFPDKPAVARALADQYGREISERWARFQSNIAPYDVAALVARMLAIVTAYLNERPALMTLLATAEAYQHDPAERDILQGHIAGVLQACQPALANPDAVFVASVVVEIIKGFSVLYRRVGEGRRCAITEEFEMVLSSYLSMRLQST